MRINKSLRNRGVYPIFMVFSRALVLLTFSLAICAHANWNNPKVRAVHGYTYSNNATHICKQMLEVAAPNTKLDMTLGVGFYIHDEYYRPPDTFEKSVWSVDVRQGIAERKAGLGSPIVESSSGRLAEYSDISRASLASLTALYAEIYPESLVQSIVHEEENVLMNENTASMSLSLPSSDSSQSPHYVAYIRHYDFGIGAFSRHKEVKELGLKASPSPAEVALKLRGIESKVFSEYRKPKTWKEIGLDLIGKPLDPQPVKKEVANVHDVAWDPPLIPRGVKIKEVGRTFVDPKLKETPIGIEQYKEARRLQELWQEKIIEDDAYYIGHCSLTSNEGFDLTLSWGFGVLEKINVNKDPKGKPQWEYIMMAKGSDFRKALQAKRLAYEAKEREKQK